LSGALFAFVGFSVGRVLSRTCCSRCGYFADFSPLVDCVRLESARGKLERFLGRVGLKAVEIQFARIPSCAHFTPGWRRVAGCNVCLVGDAAAQVKVNSTDYDRLLDLLHEKRSAVGVLQSRPRREHRLPHSAGAAALPEFFRPGLAFESESLEASGGG
jgi:hypothetical protein